MGSLFTSLLNSTGALRVYGRTFNVIQNNITNANTPGYVRQDQVLVSMPFNPDQGLPGGVLWLFERGRAEKLPPPIIAVIR